jgi:hypothetical protein
MKRSVASLERVEMPTEMARGVDGGVPGDPAGDFSISAMHSYTS